MFSLAYFICSRRSWWLFLETIRRMYTCFISSLKYNGSLKIDFIIVVQLSQLNSQSQGLLFSISKGSRDARGTTNQVICLIREQFPLLLPWSSKYSIQTKYFHKVVYKSHNVQANIKNIFSPCSLKETGLDC